MDDITVPVEKAEVVEAAHKKYELVMSQYNEGLISEEEKVRLNSEIWLGAKAEIEKHITRTFDTTSPAYDMVTSGARGSIAQVIQMAGMKGLIQNNQGKTLEFPIIPCYHEGLSPIEYFITTHGARKGASDTALNTAKSGYLTRKMFVVAQDTIITEEDCGTKEGVLI